MHKNKNRAAITGSSSASVAKEVWWHVLGFMSRACNHKRLRWAPKDVFDDISRWFDNAFACYVKIKNDGHSKLNCLICYAANESKETGLVIFGQINKISSQYANEWMAWNSSTRYRRMVWCTINSFTFCQDGLTVIWDYSSRLQNWPKWVWKSRVFFMKIWFGRNS